MAGSSPLDGRGVAPVVAILAVALVALAGCGAGEDAGGDAVLSVYVSGPLTGRQGRALCRGAERALARSGGRADSFRVRVICLIDGGAAGKGGLAAAGAGARSAVEDSTAVAYVVEAGTPVNRFTTPIVEAAGIPAVEAASGAAAMRRVLRAIRMAGTPETSAGLRDSVSESLAR